MDRLLTEKAKFESTSEELEIDFTGFVFPVAVYLPPRISFEKQVNLTGSIFEGDAGFHGATFKGDASFDNAIFRGDAVFWKAKFADVGFHDTLFLARVDLGARFNGIAIFERTLFQRDTIESENLAYLTSSTPLATNSRPIVRVSFTTFDGAKVGSEGEIRFLKQTKFTRNEVAINRCIDRVSFLNADLERFNFQDVDWGTYEGRKAIIEEVLMGKEGPFRNITPQQVRRTYAGLRRNQEMARRYAEAGDFFVGEMEMRRLELQGGRKHLPPLDRLPEWLILGFYRHLAMYGESILLPVYWAVIGILSFGLARVISTSGYGPEGVGGALMDSLMAFFQMRSEPGIDVIERLVAVPILGSLFIAMSRKFKRR